MERDRFILATQVVNPFLTKYRSYLIEKYGVDVLNLKSRFISYNDVYLYAQIEKLQKELAFGRISKKEFADSLLALTKQQHDLPPEVVQIVRDLYEALTGQSLPALRSVEAVKKKTEAKRESASLADKNSLGVCPRCSIMGDCSEKVLMACGFCGELYCERHVTPRLIATFSQYIANPERYRDLAPIVRAHWTSTNGHPCIAYTVWFWRTYNESRSRTKLSERGREERTAEVTSVALKSRTPEKTVLAERKKVKKITILIALIILSILFLIFLNSDFDGDGLTNWVEIKRGLNFLDVDTDKDFLDDEYELRLGTNPLAKDTDGDGLSDWYEVVHGTSPSKVDTDDDGLTDDYEFLISTNPLDADTDRDELIDALELRIGTDPLNNDTDKDGLLDGYEHKIGTNPIKADTDGDGLSDSMELKLATDPLKADTDGDGLLDGFELGIGTNPLSWDTDDDGLSDGEELRRGTKPFLNDTDADGLLDGVELRIGTDPLNNDTDKDGLLDGYEHKIGTNPLRNWRMFFDEDTIKSALSKFFRMGVSQLAFTLRGKTPAETVWNVLKWLDENINYDYEKAKRSIPYYYYSPPETVKMRKGICVDYSLLTAALLLESGLSEAYILDLSSNFTGHVATAVVVNGRTYVLDQKMPPLRYEEYESYFSRNEQNVWRIETVYKVTLDRAGEPLVEVIDPAQLPKGERMTDAEISSAVYRALRSLNPRLQWDSVLESIVRTALTEDPSLLYYYYTITLRLHPATLSVDFAEAWLNEMFRNGKDIIGRFSRICVYVRQAPSERTITIIIVLAS
ncbi:MAG: transglutaminase-like domain-containing protein [Thermofilaceae archaeon]